MKNHPPQDLPEYLTQKSPRYSPALCIVVISFLGLIVGSSVLIGVSYGFISFLLGPLFAIFGWFYLPPIILFVSFLWAIYNPDWPKLGKLIFVFLGGLVSSILMSYFGVNDPQESFLLGYKIGGFIAGSTCVILISLCRKYTYE